MDYPFFLAYYGLEVGLGAAALVLKARPMSNK